MRLVLVLLVSLIVAHVSHVNAAPSDRAAALAMAKAGEAKYRAGQYTAAAILLERAFALYPEPVLLYDLAKARLRSGAHAPALDAFRNYLALAPSNARNREDAELQVRALEEAAVKSTSRPEAPNRPADIARPDEPISTTSPPAVTSAANVSPTPAATLAAPTTAVAAPMRATTDRPLYKRWWLWTTVGVVVVGAGLGFGLGFGLRSAPTTYPNAPVGAGPYQF